MHDRSECAGGGGAAPREGEKLVPRPRTAGREAGDRAAESDERHADRRELLRATDTTRVSPVGRTAGCAAGRCAARRIGDPGTRSGRLSADEYRTLRVGAR